VQSVSSGANCQLSCTLRVPINLSYQLNMLHELSALSIRSTVVHQLDSALQDRLQDISLAVMSAQAHLVSSAAICSLFCPLEPQLR